MPKRIGGFLILGYVKGLCIHYKGELIDMIWRKGVNIMSEWWKMVLVLTLLGPGLMYSGMARSKRLELTHAVLA